MKCHKTIEQLTGYEGNDFKFSMDMKLLIDDLLDPNINIPVHPITLKTKDGDDVMMSERNPIYF